MTTLEMVMFLEGSVLKQGIKLWVASEIGKGKLYILVSIGVRVSRSLLYMSPPPKNPPRGEDEYHPIQEEKHVVKTLHTCL